MERLEDTHKDHYRMMNIRKICFRERSQRPANSGKIDDMRCDEDRVDFIAVYIVKSLKVSPIDFRSDYICLYFMNTKPMKLHHD